VKDHGGIAYGASHMASTSHRTGRDFFCGGFFIQKQVWVPTVRCRLMFIVLLTNRVDYEPFLGDAVFAFDGVWPFEFARPTATPCVRHAGGRHARAPDYGIPFTSAVLSVNSQGQCKLLQAGASRRQRSEGRSQRTDNGRQKRKTPQAKTPNIKLGANRIFRFLLLQE